MPGSPIGEFHAAMEAKKPHERVEGEGISEFQACGFAA
jgi:hypothetical protein